MGLEPTASQVVNQTLYPLSYEGDELRRERNQAAMR